MGYVISIPAQGDLGTVYDVTGPANGGHTNLEQNIAVPGAEFHAERKLSLIVTPVLTFDGTGMTGITAKIQAKDKAGNWFDLVSTRQSSGVSQVSHAFVAADPETALITTGHQGTFGQRMVFTATGAATKAADHAVVTAACSAK